MEKEKVIEELNKIVSEFLESKTDRLEDAVNLAINFSKENSISPDSLIKLSCSCGFNKMYSLVYVFSKACAIISTEYIKKANAHYNAGVASFLMGRKDEAEKQYLLSLKAYPKSVSTHLCYGNLLRELGRTKEAETQYLLALKIDPNNVDVHSNYGALLQELGHTKEAETQYLLALKSKPNDGTVHYNYGNLLRELGRIKEAEIQYQIANKLNPEDVDIYYNYGHLLKDIGREKEAETQYKYAIELNPKHVSAHYNYGNLLRDLGREKEAEIEYQCAIELDPENPNRHASYSLLLVSMNLEQKAIERANIASSLFNEKGDITNGHLILACLYEDLVSRYYDLKKYQESGQYAETSGDKYIEASKHAGEEYKGTFLTNGYTLKGRAKIRKLDMPDLQSPYTIETFKEIMNGIYDASEYYKLAAEVSPLHNENCNACSLSMRCLCEILDYMLAVTKQEEVQRLQEKIKKWEEDLSYCDKIYRENRKGKSFLQSLHKLIACIESLEQYKKFAMWTEEKAFENCYFELKKIASTIEGPLQKIIENSAEQMNHCRSEITLYEGFKTKPFKSSIYKNKALESNNLDKQNIDYFAYKEQLGKDIVKIGTVQMSFELTESFPPQIKNKETTRDKVFKVLDTANKENVNIVCLPELCICENWLSEIEKRYPDIIIIAGSYYDLEGHNVCRVIMGSDTKTLPPQFKITPSEFEDPIVCGLGMVSGERINTYPTSYGKFIVLICRDFGNLCTDYRKRPDVDILFVPSFNSASRRFHQDAHAHVENSFSYVIISNTAKYGGTAIFGRMKDSYFPGLVSKGFKRKDDRTFKLCELNKGVEGMIIADFNIVHKFFSTPTPMNPDVISIPVKNIKVVNLEGQSLEGQSLEEKIL